jgi:hypothetical protein
MRKSALPNPRVVAPRVPIRYEADALAYMSEAPPLPHDAFHAGARALGPPERPPQSPPGFLRTFVLENDRQS